MPDLAAPDIPGTSPPHDLPLPLDTQHDPFTHDTPAESDSSPAPQSSRAVLPSPSDSPLRCPAPASSPGSAGRALGDAAQLRPAFAAAAAIECDSSPAPRSSRAVLPSPPDSSLQCSDSASSAAPLSSVLGSGACGCPVRGSPSLTAVGQPLSSHSDAHWDRAARALLDGGFAQRGIVFDDQLTDQLTRYSGRLRVEFDVHEDGVSLGRGLIATSTIPAHTTFTLMGGVLQRSGDHVRRGYCQRITFSDAVVDGYTADVAQLPPLLWGMLINSSHGLPGVRANALPYFIEPAGWRGMTPPGVMGVRSRGRPISAGSRIYLSYFVPPSPAAASSPAPPLSSTSAVSPSGGRALADAAQHRPAPVAVAALSPPSLPSTTSSDSALASGDCGRSIDGGPPFDAAAAAVQPSSGHSDSHWSSAAQALLDGGFAQRGIVFASRIVDQLALYSGQLRVEFDVHEGGVSLGRGLVTASAIPAHTTFTLMGGVLRRSSEHIRHGHCARIPSSGVFVDGYAVDVAQLPPLLWGMLINSSRGLRGVEANSLLHLIEPSGWRGMTPPGVVGIRSRSRPIPAGSRIYLSYFVPPSPDAAASPASPPSPLGALPPSVVPSSGPIPAAVLPVADSRRPLGVDGFPLPFIVAPSRIGPLVPENRGLFVAEGCSIAAGTFFRVHISQLLELDPADDPAVPIAALEAQGYHLLPLSPIRPPLVPRSMVVSRPDDDGPPLYVPYASVVGARELGRPTWAAMHPRDSPFNIMNDAGYAPVVSTRREYVQRSQRYNHAFFALGFGPSAVCDELYMYFSRGASAGEEVYAEYDWHHWASRPPPDPSLPSYYPSAPLPRRAAPADSGRRSSRRLQSSVSPSSAGASRDFLEPGGAEAQLSPPPGDSDHADPGVTDAELAPVDAPDPGQADPDVMDADPAAPAAGARPSLRRSRRAQAEASVSLAFEDVAHYATRDPSRILALTDLIRRRPRGGDTSDVLDGQVAEAVGRLECDDLTRATSGAGHSGSLTVASSVALAAHIRFLEARSVLVVGCGTGREWAVLTALSQLRGTPLHLQLVDNVANHLWATRLLLCRVAAAVAGDVAIAAQLLHGNRIVVGNVTIDVEHRDGYSLPISSADVVYSAASLAGHQYASESLPHYLQAISPKYLCMYWEMWRAAKAARHVAPEVEYEWPDRASLRVEESGRKVVTKDLRGYPRFVQARFSQAVQVRAAGIAAPWPPSWPTPSPEEVTALEHEHWRARVHLRPPGWVPLSLTAVANAVDLGLRVGSRVAVFFEYDDWWYFGKVEGLQRTTFSVLFDDNEGRTIDGGDYVLFLPEPASGDMLVSSQAAPRDSGAAEGDDDDNEGGGGGDTGATSRDGVRPPEPQGGPSGFGSGRTRQRQSCHRSANSSKHEVAIQPTRSSDSGKGLGVPASALQRVEAVAIDSSTVPSATSSGLPPLSDDSCRLRGTRAKVLVARGRGRGRSGGRGRAPEAESSRTAAPLATPPGLSSHTPEHPEWPQPLGGELGSSAVVATPSSAAEDTAPVHSVRHDRAPKGAPERLTTLDRPTSVSPLAPDDPLQGSTSPQPGTSPPSLPTLAEAESPSHVSSPIPVDQGTLLAGSQRPPGKVAAVELSSSRPPGLKPLTNPTVERHRERTQQILRALRRREESVPAAAAGVADHPSRESESGPGAAAPEGDDLIAEHCEPIDTEVAAPSTVKASRGRSRSRGRSQEHDASCTRTRAQAVAGASGLPIPSRTPCGASCSHPSFPPPLRRRASVPASVPLDGRAWDVSTPCITRILPSVDLGAEAILGQCPHGHWCYVQHADVPPSTLDDAGVTLCSEEGCIQLAMEWWLAYTSSKAHGVWALCEHSKAVLLHGCLHVHVQQLHGVCDDGDCRAAAIAIGPLPPPDTDRMLHAPTLSLRDVLESLAALVANAATAGSRCRQVLAAGDLPIAVVLCGGRSDRADGYPAALWRAGFVVVNVDTCNSTSHTLLDEAVRAGLTALCSAGVVVSYSSQQPCGAFSVLRFKPVPGQPWKWPILVDVREPNGRLAMWQHPTHGRFLRVTWHILELVTRLFVIVDKHGGFCFIENPPSYGFGPSHVPGFEDHSSVFETQLFVDARAATNAQLLQHDQCVEAGASHGVAKRTAFMVNGTHVQSCQRFTVFCPHPAGAHQDTVGAGAAGARGDARNSRRWSAYPREYVNAIVQVTPTELFAPTAAIAAAVGSSQGDAPAACQACGVSGVPLLVRLADGQHFCNNRREDRTDIHGATCIVAALYQGACRALGVSLCPPSPFCDIELRCVRTGDRDVFRLGVARAIATGVAVVIREDVFANFAHVLDSDSWLPLVQQSAFPTWLTGAAVGRTLAISARVQGDAVMPPPCRARYSGLAEYLRTLSGWVRTLQRAEERRTAVVSPCTPTFRVGLDGDLRVSIPAVEVESLRVSKVGTQILLECARDGQSSWVGRSTVSHLPGESGGPRFRCVVHEHDGPPPVGAYFASSVTSDVAAERMQYAIRLFCSAELAVGVEVLHTILGWQFSPAPDHASLPSPLTWCAPGLPAPNHSQREAIASAVFRPRGVSIIQGPPGTGKTDTLAALAYFLFQQRRGAVLLATPSNSAADNLALRLRRTGMSTIRISAPGRAAGALPDELTLTGHARAFVGHRDAQTLAHLDRMLAQIGELSRGDLRRRDDIVRASESAAIAAASVVVVTCATAGERRIMAHSFPIVIVDEATQATEPEVLVPITRGCQQLILVGDDQQLGPVVSDVVAAKAGLQVSLFSRLLSSGYPSTMLKVQYRMHPSISRFPSLEFYDDKLEDGVTAADRTPTPSFPWVADEPVLFLSVAGSEERGGSTGSSKSNQAEADAVVAAVAAFLRGGVVASQIGVVAPYAAQQQLIAHGLQAQLTEAEVADIQLSAVESFQGGERDYVCVSFVRSGSSQLGFVSDPRRLCVALTRARRGLFMVGNPHTLAAHSVLFGRMLQNYAQRGLLVETVDGRFGRWQPFGGQLAPDIASTAWASHVFERAALAAQSAASEITVAATSAAGAALGRPSWADMDDDDTLPVLPFAAAAPAPALQPYSALVLAQRHSLVDLLDREPTAAVLLSGASWQLVCAIRASGAPSVVLSDEGLLALRQWVTLLPSVVPAVHLAPLVTSELPLRAARASAVSSVPTDFALFLTIEVFQPDHPHSGDVASCVATLQSEWHRHNRPFALLCSAPFPASVSADPRFTLHHWPAGCAGVSTVVDWWVLVPCTSSLTLAAALQLPFSDVPLSTAASIRHSQRAMLLGVDPVLVSRCARLDAYVPPSVLIELVIYYAAADRLRSLPPSATAPLPAVIPSYIPLEDRVFISDRRGRRHSRLAALPSPVSSGWPPVRASQFSVGGDGSDLLEQLTAVDLPVADAAAAMSDVEPTSSEIAQRYVALRTQFFGEQRASDIDIASEEARPRKGSSSRTTRPCVTVAAELLVVVTGDGVLARVRGDSRLALPAFLAQPMATTRRVQIAHALAPWTAGRVAASEAARLARHWSTSPSSFGVQFSYPPPGASGFGRAHSGVAICYDCTVHVVRAAHTLDFSPAPFTPHALDGEFYSHLLLPFTAPSGVTSLIPVDALSHAIADLGTSTPTTLSPVPVASHSSSGAAPPLSPMAVGVVLPPQLVDNLSSTGRGILAPCVRLALLSVLPLSSVPPADTSASAGVHPAVASWVAAAAAADWTPFLKRGGPGEEISPPPEADDWDMGLQLNNHDPNLDHSSVPYSHIEVSTHELRSLLDGTSTAVTVAFSQKNRVGQVLLLTATATLRHYVRIDEVVAASCYSDAFDAAAARGWVADTSRSSPAERNRQFYQHRCTMNNNDEFHNLFTQILSSPSDSTSLETWLGNLRRHRALQVVKVSPLPLGALPPRDMGKFDFAFPTISPSVVATLGRLHGPRGSRVAAAFSGADGEPKTVDVRLLTERLYFISGKTAPVTELHRGGQFLYVEKGQAGETTILLLEVTAEPCTFASRGHVVAYYKNLALPRSLLSGFESPYPEYSIEFGNHFYHHRISLRSGAFRPNRQHYREALGIQVRLLGQVLRSEATSMGGSLAEHLLPSGAWAARHASSRIGWYRYFVALRLRLWCSRKWNVLYRLLKHSSRSSPTWCHAAKVWFARVVDNSVQLLSFVRSDSDPCKPQFDTFGGKMDAADQHDFSRCALREIHEEAVLPQQWSDTYTSEFSAFPDGFHSVDLYHIRTGVQHRVATWLVLVPSDHHFLPVHFTHDGSREAVPDSLRWRPAMDVISNLAAFRTFSPIASALSSMIRPHLPLSVSARVAALDATRVSFSLEIVQEHCTDGRRSSACAASGPLEPLRTFVACSPHRRPVLIRPVEERHIPISRENQEVCRHMELGSLCIDPRCQSECEQWYDQHRSTYADITNPPASVFCISPHRVVYDSTSTSSANALVMARQPSGTTASVTPPLGDEPPSWLTAAEDTLIADGVTLTAASPDEHRQLGEPEWLTKAARRSAPLQLRRLSTLLLHRFAITYFQRHCARTGQDRARSRWASIGSALRVWQARQSAVRRTACSAAAEASDASTRGPLLTSVSLPGGVLHKLVKNSVDGVVRIADCVSLQGASSLGRVRANATRTRCTFGEIAACETWSEPGTVDVFEPSPGRVAANVYAQFQPGAARASNELQPGPLSDTADQRGEWLTRGLRQFLRRRQRLRTVAVDWTFPEECDAGTRAAYLQSLRTVAALYPKTQFILIQSPASMISELQDKARQERAQVDEWLSQMDGDPLEKALGRALVDQLDAAILQGGFGSEHLVDEQSVKQGVERAALEVACRMVAGDCSNKADAFVRLRDHSVAYARKARNAARIASASTATLSSAAAAPLVATATGDSEERYASAIAASAVAAGCARYAEERAHQAPEDCAPVDGLPEPIHRAFMRIAQAVDKVREGNDKINVQYRSHVKAALAAEEFSLSALAESYHAIGLCAEPTGHPCQTPSVTVTASAPGVGHVGDAAIAHPPEAVQVSSADAQRYTPSRILGDVFLLGSNGEREPLGRNIWDGGSSTMLMGLDYFTHMQQRGCARKATRLDTSITAVNGIGAMNLVHFHAAVTMEFGGAVVECHDIPVIANFNGILIGNDFMKPCKALTDLAVEEVDGVACDGVAVLQSGPQSPCSRPVPLAVTQQTAGAFQLSDTSAAAADAAGFTPESVCPIAYAPEALRVPAWSERILWVRVPQAAVAGHDIALLPLEDDRAPDVGVLVAPGLVRANEKGMVPLRVLNLSKQPVTVPVLTPMARFIVDPEIAGTDLEYTTDDIMERIHLPEDATAEDLALIRHMISLRRRLFASTVGVAHGYKARLDTPLIDSGQVDPPAVPSRRRSPEEYAALVKEIDKQLKAGLLQKVRSPYNAMPILIKKPGTDEYRVVIDWRLLNKYTVKDTYPLPNIEENLALLGESNLFTVCDLLQGFFQVELEESSVLKTAFSTPLGQVAYTRMPMGLTSSPSAFMRLVDAALAGLPPGLALAFVDDVCIPTRGDMKQHMIDVGRVFDRLIEAGFRVKCSKVHIGKREVRHLGFLVGDYGTRPDPAKFQAILDLAVSSVAADTAKAARFAGMMGFYSRFIPHLQAMLDPFHRLKVKGADSKHILQSLRLRASFAACKHALANVTAIARPRSDRPYYIHCDTASTGNISAVLSQRDDDDDPTSHRPLAFYSRKLTDEERGYPVRDQECLALVEAFKQWRPYLCGARSIVCTDHSSLVWLLTTSHRDGSRVARWANDIAPYMPEIQYIPGKDNVVADFLSRTHASAVLETGGDGDAEPDSENASGTAALPSVPVAPLAAAAATELGEEHYASRIASSAIAAGCTRYVDELTYLASITTTSAVNAGIVNYIEDTSFADASRRSFVQDFTILALNAMQEATPIVLRGETWYTHVHVKPSRNQPSAEGAAQLQPAQAKQLLTLQVASLIHAELPASDRQSLQELQQQASDAGAFAVSCEAEAPGHEPRRGTLLLPGVHPAPAYAATGSATANAERIMSSVAGALLRRDSQGGLRIALERFDGTYSLPRKSTNVDSSSTYRAQLLQYLQARVDSPSFDVIAKYLRFVKRRRVAKGGETLQYYVAALPPGQQIHSADDGTFVFMDIDQAFDAVEDDLDSHVIAAIADNWNHSSGRYRDSKSKHRMPPSTVHNLLNAVEPRNNGECNVLVPPTIHQASAEETAHVTDLADSLVAVSRIRERLLEDPRSVIAVDLEGQLRAVRPKIDLIQISVDSVDRPNLTYVFNVHHDRRILAAKGADTLRSVLENDTVKILHCCRGDAAALFGEFGIQLNKAFDTAIADSVLKGRHFNTQRSLEKVLLGWLGDEVVHLSHKGKLSHTPGMFQEWPLPMSLYVYAYEDVLYLGALYRQLRAELEEVGLLEFVVEQSRRRCISPKQKEVRAATVAIALTDGLSVVCLEEGGRVSLPCGSINGDESTVELKQIARRIWEQQMGPPPRGGIAQAINGSLQKPVRIGDTIVLVAAVADCDSWLPALQAARDAAGSDGDHKLVCHSYCTGLPGDAAVTQQQLVFQYLGAVADRTGCSNQRSGTALSTENTLALQVQLVVTKPTGRVRVSIAVNQSHVPADGEVAAATGPVDPVRRAAVIITDGKLVYLIGREDRKGDPASRHWSFPSHRIETDSNPEEAAVKAIDLWAGAAVRKGGDPCSILSDFALLPALSRKMFEASQNMTCLGEFGSTVYLVCTIDDMQQHLGDFCAARNEETLASFRLTDQQKRQYDDFAVAKPSLITVGVNTSDIQALQAARDRGLVQTVFAADEPYQEVKRKKQKQVQVAAAAAAAAHLSDTAAPLHTPGDYEAALRSADGRLIEAATLIRLAAALEVDGAFAAVATAARLPRDADVDATGAPPRFYTPTTAEIAEEQRHHPALRPIILTLQGVDPTETGAPLRGSLEYAAFAKELELHALQEGTGLLLRWCAAGGPDESDKLQKLSIESGYRVVLPPKFHTFALTSCHDRAGHLGVRKCFSLLYRRYAWGSASEMRSSLANHINECPVCRRCKVSRHKVGEGTLVSNGEWAFDVVSADHFKVGRQSKADATDERIVGVMEDEDDMAADEDGDASPKYFDGTVTFADQFTRAVVCAPVKGQPTAQMVARLLTREVIRHYGTPRQLRSDQGSAFVAATVKALYDAFGIRMQAGSAYHHSTVGLVERWHSCLKSLLLTHRIASGEDQWHHYLPLMELIFNSTVNTALGYSPFFLNHMIHPRLPSDALTQSTLKRLPASIPDWVREALQRLGVVYDEVAKTLKTNALHSKRVYDLKRDVVSSFEPGDRVLLLKGQLIDGNLPKAEEPTEGPFTVVRRLPRNRYVLSGPQGRKVKEPIHIDRMVQFPNRRSIPQEELESMFPVKRIADRRIVQVPDAEGGSKPQVQYKVQWVGFGKRYPYWYSMDYLHDVAELVADYNRNAPPLPPELAAETLEFESRDVDLDDPVEADAAAQKRKHFRAIHRPSAVREGPDVGTTLPPAELDTSQVPLLPGPVADPFPAGTRVEIFHKEVDRYWGGTGVDAWLPATVRSTRVFRPRNGRRPERRISVVYDCDPQQEEYETRPSSLVRRLEETAQEQPAQQNVVRKSPRLQAMAAAAFEWARPRWVGCPHQGAVLAGGDQHALLPRHHRCFNHSCIRAAQRWRAESPGLFETGAGRLAQRVGVPLGTIGFSFERSDVRNCMNDAYALTATASDPAELEDEDGDWASVAIDLEGTTLGHSLGSSFQKASVVYHRTKGRWQRWLLVLQSAALHSINVEQWGLYSLRPFTGTEARGDVIAPHYPGDVVYRGRTIDCEEARRVVTKLVSRGHDRLLAHTGGSGMESIIDGKGLPPVWRANAITNIKGAKKSFRFTTSGAAVAIRRIAALPVDFTELTLPDLLPYELLTTYGADYWRLIKDVGTDKLPLDIDSD